MFMFPIKIIWNNRSEIILYIYNFIRKCSQVAQSHIVSVATRKLISSELFYVLETTMQIKFSRL